MNLKQRLTLFTLLVVVLASGSVGFFLIASNTREQSGKLKVEIEQIKSTIKNSENEKISVALSLVDSSDYRLSLLLADENGEFVPLADNLEISGMNMAISDLSNVRELATIGNLLVREVQVEGAYKLVLVGSTASISENRDSSLLRLLLFLSLASLLSLGLLRIVISRDIERESENIKLSENLRNEAEKRQMLLEFASDASHELRTPLTVIKGYLELAKIRRDGKIDDQALERLLRETERIDRNISNLLKMLEFESEAPEQIHEISLTELFTEESRAFADRNPSRSVEIDVVDNLQVMASENLLLTLIRNIMSNIERHTPIDAKVRIKARNDKDSVLVTIEDGGPFRGELGFDLENYLTRFNPARSSSKGGSGLGFSIIAKSVNKLSGRIQLFQSEIGGLGILITLPKV